MYDSKYDSKMHDIVIPLMGFNGFHHASNNESKEDFQDFIGRESIMDKLRSWLEDHEQKKDKKYSGAYLITGFRGMGKSSFVYKTILDIKRDAKENKYKTCHYVPISINVGNDLLTSKELLYIICKLLSASFEEKTRWGHNKRSQLNLLPAFFIILAIAIPCIFHICRNFISISDYVYFLPFMIMVTVLLCYSVRYLYYIIWSITDWPFFITTWQIKKTFHHLNKRIDSEMTETSEYGMDSAKNAKPFDVVPGIRFIKNKTNVYPIAQTSEIQDLLVSQLRLIKRLWYVNFRFIFIIDELDKVSPEDDEKEIIPEYEYTNAVNGNSSYRSRQKALAGLLANMKYFISSSEAKFIFITGYDMYEATLADISNREFNIHSIFNGYINVSSFLRKTGKSKGADSMIEEYFCHLLLEKPENAEYKRNDLRDYANFFYAAWKQQGNQLKTKRYEQLMERRITFMRHFLTYLFYMSNGSPKKLAIYLEKYVRSKKRVEEQYELKHNDKLDEEYDDLALGVDSFWEDCEWFLYFDVRSIQKIEFINYLIYPMIKNLIAKSSTYNDKLLIATSFMISNLYKFHKSGFSWRNLEYMPELLDINKMPELREFIGGILQFLNQTHIDEVTANLYMFKFPQRLSEEITFFSKTAEEISYLFNFSHDELLSIKTLYNKQLDHYSSTKGYESPAIASLHHLLGDIYMLEENYEQAIFEFNEALDAIGRQEKGSVEDFIFDIQNLKKNKDSSNLLFKIFVSLKLGLAYEKRKTFDTAYIVYENLTRMLLDIAVKSQPVQENRLEENEKHAIIQHLDSNATFFSNIRIAYLGILAKVAVLEKMDLGGIRENDLWRQIQEFDLIEKRIGKEIRPIVNMDFYTKLGIILYFNNYRSSDDFVNKLRVILELTTETDKNKYDDCKKCTIDYKPDSSGNQAKMLLTPCMACQYYNKSLKTCMDELGGDIKKYESRSKAIYFLELYNNNESLMSVQRMGSLFVMAMSDALLGMGNTLLGCAKAKKINYSYFFKALHEMCDAFDNDDSFKFDKIDESHLSPYSKSFLYYLAAAEGYKILTDYKAAYNTYTQILDAVAVYYHVVLQEDVPKETLEFCQIITRKAIHCAYLHYDSINCAEVDTQKHELGKSYVDYINLHSLTSFPEIEVAIDKYYRIRLMGDEAERNDVIKNVIKSRQLGRYKLISTLTQNIQNLCLKISVNEEILSRIMPNVSDSFKTLKMDCEKTIPKIVNYYVGKQKIDELLEAWDWNLFDKGESSEEKKFGLLDYLLKDTLYCLNLITELIEPLYSTTLYSNAFIGDIYRKTFMWNHILICIRELFEYTDSQDKVRYMNDFFTRSNIMDAQKQRDIESLFKQCSTYFESLPSWAGYSPSGISKVESIYLRISPNSGDFMTSSYLTETAIDRFNKSIEMHTSGKTYKEMMTTLFFLEDDLQNDSNYMNLAIERFLINHGKIRERMNQLKTYEIKKTSLLQIDNYVKQ